MGMTVTSKVRYAVTSLIDVSLHQHDGYISLADIAKRQNIPLSTLGHLFAHMAKHQLVKGKRGPGGGYRLAKEPTDISLAAVMSSVDENMDSRRCNGQKNCQANQICLTHTLWETLNDRLNDLLMSISLSDVVSNRKTVEVAMRQDELSPGDLDSAAQH